MLMNTCGRHIRKCWLKVLKILLKMKSVSQGYLLHYSHEQSSFTNTCGKWPSHLWQRNISATLCSHKKMYGVSLLAQTVKNLPAVQERAGWSLGQEDTLEKGMVIHSSILAWRIPWTEEPGRLQSMGSLRVRHDWATNTFKKMCTLVSSTSKKLLLPFLNSCHWSESLCPEGEVATIW